MSIVLSSDSVSSSLRLGHAPRNSAGAQSRLHVRLVIEKSLLADIAGEVIRLAEQFMPEVSHFLVAGGGSITLRVRQGELRVCQTDMFVCRLARVRGICNIRAEQKTIDEGVVYGAFMRGRSWKMRPVAHG